MSGTDPILDSVAVISASDCPSTPGGTAGDDGIPSRDVLGRAASVTRGTMSVRSIDPAAEDAAAAGSAKAASPGRPPPGVLAPGIADGGLGAVRGCGRAGTDDSAVVAAAGSR